MKISHFFLTAATVLVTTSSIYAGRIDFNDASAWNGGTGFTYAFTDTSSSDHTNILPYVEQVGLFDGIGLTITYEHSMAFSQGVLVNEYELVSNQAELNAYGSVDDRGLIRIAADSNIDTFGDNDGITTVTFNFDQDVFIQDFLIGSIDSVNGAARSDNVEVRALDFGGSIIAASSENLDFLSVASGDAQVADGLFGRRFFAQPGGDQIHAVALDWTTTGIRSIEVQIYGTISGALDLSNNGYSAAITGFVVNPVPEPTTALLFGIAAFGFLSRRRR